MRILIIEDEQRLAATIADLLHRQGYTADTCHDGATGLDNAQSGIYDLPNWTVFLSCASCATAETPHRY